MTRISTSARRGDGGSEISNRYRSTEAPDGRLRCRTETIAMNTRRQPHEIPQALNALVIALQLTAIAACIWICRSASGWTLFVLAAAFGLVMTSVYSVILAAEH